MSLALERALRFAVARAREAEEAYKGWARSATTEAERVTLQELGAAEHDHAELLEHVTPPDVLAQRHAAPPDGAIRELLVGSAALPKSLSRSALDAAAGRESVLTRLFEQLAGLGGEAAPLFRTLAKEERAHKARLESLGDR